MPATAMAPPAGVIERFTGPIGALLGDVGARGAHPPLRYLNWVTRAFGPTVAAELARQRRAQYGFCPTGHHRSARSVREPTGRAIRTQLFCPSCEAAA